MKKIFKEMEIELTVRCYKSGHHDDIDGKIKDKIKEAKDLDSDKNFQIPGVYVFLADNDCCNRCLKVGNVGKLERRHKGSITTGTVVSEAE